MTAGLHILIERKGIMHKYEASNGTLFHYNPDMSGDVYVHYIIDGKENFATLNGDDIFDFIAEVVRERKIERIENMTTLEVLSDA